MKVLIIGGTRHMGYLLALDLLGAGHDVTVLNRGISRNDLPDTVKHLKADRTIPAQLEKAVDGQEFDAVIDFVMYDGTDAEVAVDLFQGKTNHYVFISSGQVYLLRTDIDRPYSEDEYEGDCILEPALNTYDHEEWLYGLQKRHAEDALARAYRERNFPYTSLRLPMVNGERDPFNRLYGYMLRLKDTGPILIPDEPDYPLRHVYAGDVVKAVRTLLETGQGKGSAFNISQDETLPLTAFLDLLGEIMGIQSQTVRVGRSLLEANGFLPDCSPFSDKWMSELTNERSKTELDMTYTPLKVYLEKLVAHYEANPPLNPISYRRRNAERQFAESYVPS